MGPGEETLALEDRRGKQGLALNGSSLQLLPEALLHLPSRMARRLLLKSRI